MAGKRWQGGKDGAMIKKRRFGRAVGFIFAPLSLFLLLLLLLLFFHLLSKKKQLTFFSLSLKTEFIFREYSVWC